MRFDIPVMTAVAVACLPIFFNGYRIARWKGGLFLAYYIAYVGYLALGAAEHPALPILSGAMLGFVIPLTVVTLAVVIARQVRRSSQGGATNSPAAAPSPDQNARRG